MSVRKCYLGLMIDSLIAILMYKYLCTLISIINLKLFKSLLLTNNSLKYVIQYLLFKGLLFKGLLFKGLLFNSSATEVQFLKLFLIEHKYTFTYFVRLKVLKFTFCAVCNRWQFIFLYSFELSFNNN
jgi:hypothetical protein